MTKKDYFEAVYDLTIQLLRLNAEYQGDEDKEEQALKQLPLDKRIIPFPTNVTAEE